MNPKLKAAREMAQKTQEQVSKEVGITVRLYQSYEYDRYTPNVKTAIKIAEVLHSTVEELFK